MSNTVYQRGMADMRLAGLNPILAYKQGGASSPAGNVAATPNISQHLSSAMAARQVPQQLKNMRAVEGRDQSATTVNKTAASLNRQKEKQSEAERLGAIAAAQLTVVNSARTAQMINMARPEEIRAMHNANLNASAKGKHLMNAERFGQFMGGGKNLIKPLMPRRN